jgi:hypothetical protein
MVLGSLTFAGCSTKQATTAEQTATRNQEITPQASRSGHTPTASGRVAATEQGTAAKEVTIKALFETPASYLGEKVQVHGEIFAIEMLGEGFIGASAIVRISPADDFSAELLRCEFSRNNPPPSTLEKGQRVTISGKVDAIEGNIVLRECSVVN